MQKFNCKASHIVLQTLDRLQIEEEKSLDHGDYVFARGIAQCKFLVESTYVQILSLENDENV
jgi:hypothetical protein